MGNGKWDVKNGKWEMGNGKWETGPPAANTVTGGSALLHDTDYYAAQHGVHAGLPIRGQHMEQRGNGMWETGRCSSRPLLKLKRAAATRTAVKTKN